ncbi:MAG: CotH kinase family protein [Bacteroidota bacterium]
MQLIHPKPSIIFLSILFLLNAFQSNAQDLPDDWTISSDGHQLLAGNETTSDFFAEDTIHQFQIQFDQANWWTLLENNYDSGTDLLATCWIDGVQYDSVGVRFKGQTSYTQNNTEKKSFNISLDYMIEDQHIEGYTTFNLNCGWGENSAMREVLFNNVGRNYYMALKSNFSTLEINGENWGPYQCIQQLNSTYLRDWFFSNDGTLWRALRIGGGGGPGNGGPFGTGSSTLNYNGSDSTDYNTDYTLKRTELIDPWANLIETCEVLNTIPLNNLEDELAQVLDIDKTCWFLAHELIFADDDSYINKGGMDYYVYFEVETGRMVPLEYDGNSVLTANHLNWDLFYHEDDSDFPLMNRMLSVPEIRQRFLAHVRTILAEYFNSDFTDPLLDNYQESIDSLILNDPKKFYTYNDWLLAVDNFRELIADRHSLLMDNTEVAGGNTLSISEVSYSVNSIQWAEPTSEDQVDIVCTISDWSNLDKAWLYFGEGLTGEFERIEMFDNGQNNDIAANDGVFGASIPAGLSGNYMRYYIAAIANDNASTVSYEPQGAEHNVFLYKIGLSAATEIPVVINELMADNEQAVTDDQGEYDDWIELYNISNEAVNLTDWRLSDDINDFGKFVFPPYVLEPNEYLVIWADEDLEQAGLHANFKLSASGESLYLLNASQELVDSVLFDDLEEDLGFARIPNGTGPFIQQTHTIGANNEGTTSIEEFSEAFPFQFYPNPASNEITIKIPQNLRLNGLEIRNSLGQGIWIGEAHSRIVIDTSSWASGIYFIQFGDDVAKLVIQK